MDDSGYLTALLLNGLLTGSLIAVGVALGLRWALPIALRGALLRQHDADEPRAADEAGEVDLDR